MAQPSWNSFLRQFPLAKAMLDELPVRARFPDGVVRTVPRNVGRLVRTWNSIAECRAESAAVLSAYEGGDIIDVGAFHGWYSLLLGNRMSPGDRAISLEPDPRAASHLLRTLAELASLFPTAEFCMLPVAIGDGKPVRVTFPNGATGHPSFASTEDTTEGAVSTVALDELVATLRLTPRFVKIDVEGAETFVLEGMQRVLSHHRPKVMLEVHHLWQPEGHTTQQLAETLTSHRYRRTTLSRSELADRELWLPV